MASTNVRNVVLRGKASYAKILGDPVLNYNKDGKNWTMDLQIDRDTVKELKGYGISDRVKTKEEYLEGNSFLSFKQPELRRDGTPNTPIKVTDAAGNDWPPNSLIGNGSDVDVKFVVMDHGVGKKTGVYIRAVRVLNLVAYDRQEFETLAEDDEFYQKAQESAKTPTTILEELDSFEDEVPV